MTSVQSDRELVVAAQRQSADAYADIYKRHVVRVRRACRSVLVNDHDVEDAVQETFLKAFDALGRFNGQYALGAWLACIARNVCLDQARAFARTPRLVALDAQHESLVIEGGPDDAVAATNPRLDGVIATIFPLHAEALRLRGLNGYSHEEMALKLGLSGSQVKALLHRARTAFKRAWDDREGVSSFEFLETLGDEGVLLVFLRLPVEAQASFMSVIGSAGNASLRHHRTTSLISALKSSPLANNPSAYRELVAAIRATA